MCLVVLLVAVLFLLVSNKIIVIGHKTIQKSYSCEPDRCALQEGKGNFEGTVTIYEGVGSEKECNDIGGAAISYYNVAGEKRYSACAPK